MSVRELSLSEGKARDIVKISSNIENLVTDLIDTMNHNSLSIISGPSIGSASRIVLTSSTQPEVQTDPLVMINPVIEDGFGEKIVIEGSKKNKEELIFVPKAYGILVSYQDLDGNKNEKLFFGSQSLEIQYEVDTLNGAIPQ